MITTSYLEITLHLTSGRRVRFLQDDPKEAVKLLERIHHERLFDQPNLMLAGGNALAVYPCATIERIDFGLEGATDWAWGRNIADVCQVTREEFERFYQPFDPDFTPPHREEAGDIRALYSRMELASGGSLYTKVRFHAESETITPDDLGMRLASIFSGPSLHSRREGGDGATLINPSNVVRFVVCPLPMETPPATWHARPIPLSE